MTGPVVVGRRKRLQPFKDPHVDNLPVIEVGPARDQRVGPIVLKANAYTEALGWPAEAEEVSHR